MQVFLDLPTAEAIPLMHVTSQPVHHGGMNALKSLMPALLLGCKASRTACCKSFGKWSKYFHILRPPIRPLLNQVTTWLCWRLLTKGSVDMHESSLSEGSAQTCSTQFTCNQGMQKMSNCSTGSWHAFRCMPCTAVRLQAEVPHIFESRY
jgi:hypothetical protein